MQRGSRREDNGQSGDRLVVTVVDDGVGLSAYETAVGRGLRSLRRLVDEFGKHLDLRQLGAGGLSLRAKLPLHSVTGSRSPKSH